MAQLAGNRYASAFFALALERNLLDEYVEEAEGIIEIFKNDADFFKMFKHPQINSDVKIELMEKVFKGKVSDDMLGLFNVVVRKNRENEIITLLHNFVEKARQYRGIAEATLYSAVALNEEQIGKIQTKLSEKLNKRVTIQTVVDPVYIGGFCVKVEGHIMDATVKTRFAEMKTQLLNTKLA